MLAKASELRAKITNCIDKASNASAEGPQQEVDGGDGSRSGSKVVELGVEDHGEDEEAESLLNIRDALESLETQLSALQGLQQQQQYERVAALNEIDHSRMMLLKKLKEYKGEDLEVLHEASAFASESVEHNNNDLLLPPYPSRPPCSFDNGYPPSHVKSARNGVISTNEANKSPGSGSEGNQSNFWKGFGNFLNSVTKTAFVVLGAVTVLNLAISGPKLKDGPDVKFFGMFQQPVSAEKRSMGEERSVAECPPGKVLVVEGGETRCLVKERVEVPFETVVGSPSVNYGFG